jgi:hypothetical protein
VTSARKLMANRANARGSTGPKTARGRTRAAQNAFRHGLSLPVCSDPALAQEVEALAREIAGSDVRAEIQELARRAAEAQIDLRRVRYARHRLLSNAFGNPFYESRADTRMKMAVLSRLLRPRAPDIPIGALSAFLTATPKGPQKFAVILSREAKQLLAMDRYERRALLRRKVALRALDDMLRRGPVGCK